MWTCGRSTRNQSGKSRAKKQNFEIWQQQNLFNFTHCFFFWYFMFGFKVLIFWGKRIDSGSICRISTTFCLFKSLHKTVFIVMRNYKEITLLKVILKIFTFRPYEFENLAGLRGGQKINGTYLDWWPGLQKVQFGEITGH